MTIGMIVPNDGSVIFDGVDVTSMPMYKRARRGMGYLSQEPSIFQRLTVAKNIMAILETLPISDDERRTTLQQGGIAPSPSILFPSPDPDCVGDECKIPPLGCVGVECFDPGFENNPVRTLWTQDGIE